jgi:hypothetical protein
MKVARFIIVAVVIVFLVTAFAPVLPIQNSAALTPSTQPFDAATALDMPFFSPIMFAASSPVFAAGGAQSSANTLAYACQLTAQSPADWTVMGRRNSFDAKWVLKNTGTHVWGTSGVDVKFRGGYPTGTKLHTGLSLFDIPYKVGPGQKLTLWMDMIAPKYSGYYVDNWGLYVGGTVFCKFYIAITVY